MPTWIQPVLRTLQEDEENANLVIKTSAPLVTKALADEAAGVAVKPPLNIIRILLGVVYKH